MRSDDAEMGARLVEAIRVDEKRLRMVPGYASHQSGQCGCDPDNGAWCGWSVKVYASGVDSEYLLALNAVREAISAEIDGGAR